MPRHKQGQHVPSKQSGFGAYVTGALEWFRNKAMFRPKEDQAPGIDFTSVLPAAVTQNELVTYLPNPDVLNVYQTSKKLKGLFQVQMDTLTTLKYVIEGNIDALMVRIQESPGLLFKKGNAKAPRGQTYYNVSPYMMMKFLCDEDMLAHIMPLIPERFKQVCQAQDVELGQGGSDLVTLDFDPMSVPSDDFNKICAFKTRVNVWGRPTDITFPLLENPDGLLYWQDAHGAVSFYYADREAQTIIPLFPVATTHEEQQELDALKHSFETMENNSARRSTNKEHQLITKLMHHALHRQGIHYSNAHGEHYCDSRTPFQLINRYRVSIRLYQEAAHNREWKRAHHYWRERVGRAQGEEMWLLQRICEANRPFYPLPQYFDGFKRGFVFYNWSTGMFEPAFNNGRLAGELGSDFALYKSRRGGRGSGYCLWAWPGGTYGTTSGAADLIAVCRLIEDAKIKTIGFALEADLALQSVPGLQR